MCAHMQTTLKPCSKKEKLQACKTKGFMQFTKYARVYGGSDTLLMFLGLQTLTDLTPIYLDCVLLQAEFLDTYKVAGRF